ncbi:hypothetical protein [Nocardiopsis sp. CC223A]|uniref:hypothetical protein n=1 Tax=Nocardiopsis sp. CC223A TaxID=3044051 RepID=UPI00278BD105|nr:hypothetical protein [Nocardiopsis sp. CC223A]
MVENTDVEDSRRSAARIVVAALVLAVPVVKLAWTLGGGPAAREALYAMGPSNIMEVVIDLFLAEPLLAASLAVVVSHMSYAYFSARGGALRHLNSPVALTVASAMVVPVAVGVVVGAINGPVWGLATCVLAALLRLTVFLEYRTGRRSPESGKRTGETVGSLWQGVADTGRVTALALTVVVLPLVAFGVAVNGHSWTTVMFCDADTGDGTERARVIELGRQGHGVTGWSLDHHQVVVGENCLIDEDEVIRPPLWQGG